MANAPARMFVKPARDVDRVSEVPLPRPVVIEDSEKRCVYGHLKVIRNGRLVCRHCEREKSRKRYADPVKRAEFNRQRRENGTGRRAQERWRARNPSYQEEWLRLGGNEYGREYRRKHPEIYRASSERWQQRNAHKRAAHVQVNEAVRSGRLLKPAFCEGCGGVASGRSMHAHHEDYAQPLRVRWLCSPCHRALHARSAIP